MANRWGNNGKLTDFIFFSSKITEDGDYSHEIKRHLVLGRKVMTNLDSILKNRDYFSNKGPSSQSSGFSSSHVWMWELDHKESYALIFPVVMYGCENWTINKAEHWRIDAFELWYWMVCPWKTNWDHFVVLESASEYWILDFFIEHAGYSISSKGFWPAVVNIE